MWGIVQDNLNWSCAPQGNLVNYEYLWQGGWENKATYHYQCHILQVYDIINKIDDDTGHLDFQVNMFKIGVFISVRRVWILLLVTQFIWYDIFLLSSYIFVSKLSLASFLTNVCNRKKFNQLCTLSYSLSLCSFLPYPPSQPPAFGNIGELSISSKLNWS